jgi:hypothetical protein
MSNSKSVNYATPVVTEVTTTTAEKVAATTTQYNAMKASPDWAAATDVQKAAGVWLQASTDLAANTVTVEALVKQLAAARAQEQILLRRWSAAHRGCISAVNTFCDGSKDKIQGFGFGVFARTARIPAGIPTQVEGKKSKVQGLAVVAWVSDGRRHEYQVQHCTNTADPTTFSAPVTVSKRTFKLAGQVQGATLHFRVLTLEPKLATGQTDWSAWVPVIVN